MFRTAWFVESIATQILVIFIIRTARPLWTSRSHPVLVATTLGALAIALIFSLTPLGGLIGFVALPLPILAAITGVSLAYLAAAEGLKHVAMRPGAAWPAGARLPAVREPAPPCPSHRGSTRRRLVRGCQAAFSVLFRSTASNNSTSG